MKIDFSYARVKNMATYWNKFEKYCSEKSIIYFDANQISLFIEDYSNKNIEKIRINEVKKALNILKDINYLFLQKEKINKFKNLNENIKLQIDEYLYYCKNVINNSLGTIDDKIEYLSYFINFLDNNNISSFENIDKHIVLKYIKSLNNEKKYKRIGSFWVLRDLLTYLFSENIIKTNYSYLIPKIKRIENQPVPTVFEKNDVIKILNQLKEDVNNYLCGKRNYAMILIATKTGLRICDIKNLKWNNIDWENNIFNIIQLKTKKSINVPFSNDVGEAIIDYIKNERPFKIKNSNDLIFIRYKYPFDKLSDAFNMHDVISRTAKKCNIDLSKYRKKGIHCFRFTLATELLKNEVPLDIIVSTLGHCNPKSTNNYLKVDINHLKECFYEVDNYV